MYSLLMFTAVTVLTTVSTTVMGRPDFRKPNIAAKIISLDPRLTFSDSVGEIFPGPVTTQKVYQ